MIPMWKTKEKDKKYIKKNEKMAKISVFVPP